MRARYALRVAQARRIIMWHTRERTNAMSDQNGTTAQTLVDTQESERALALLVAPGEVVEVRALEASMQSHARYTDTLAG